MTIKKLLYLLTPPVVTKIVQKLTAQKKSSLLKKPYSNRNLEEEFINV